MTATERKPAVGSVDLLELITRGRKPPPGCDSFAIKSVHPDGSTSHGFVWPLTTQTVKASGPMLDHESACPREVGDGLCLATSWRGMASGGIVASTLLLIAFSGADVRGTDPGAGKLRVSECVVVEVVDGARLLRERGAYANLDRANLDRANLDRASLNGASLDRANLDGASLNGANLDGASLNGANLDGASLYGALVYATTVLPAGFDPVAAGCVVFDATGKRVAAGETR